MSEKKVHWLHGEDTRLYPVEEEIDCRDCAHVHVCERREDLRCSNFNFGTSAGHPGCQQCLHKYTRWANKDPWPCFVCKDFRPVEILDDSTTVLVEFNGQEHWLHDLKSRRDIAREEMADG